MIYKERKFNLIRAFQFGVDDNELEVLPATDLVDPPQLNTHCTQCGQLIRNHGFLKNDRSYEMVCPGDFIIYENRKVINIVSNDAFKKAYVKMEIEDVCVIE